MIIVASAARFVAIPAGNWLLQFLVRLIFLLRRSFRLPLHMARLIRTAALRR